MKGNPALIIGFGREDGQAAIALVLAMSLFALGGLGLALDGAQMYAQRQMAQAAADAAAEAGMMSIMRGTNATSAYTFGTGAAPIASYTCTTTDGRTPCVYARNNGFGGTSSDTVTLSYPSSVSGVSLSSATPPALKVTVQRNVSTGFIRLIGGPATTAVQATATTGTVGTVSPDSIYVLDHSAKDAFEVSGSATVTVSGGAIVVNSNNAEAALIQGSAHVSAAAINVTGGTSIQGSASTSPAPAAGTTPVADPFATLPALTPASCATHPTNYSPPNGAILTPGTYCGGITVGGSESVTFSTGQYIIDGGGISFGGSSTSTGSGVIFYLTGTNATYGSVTAVGSATVTLSAPTTGAYTGVLFFQDRSITSANNATFGGSATIAFTGSLYFPTTYVSFAGSSGANYMAVVADEVSFTGSSSLKYDPTGLKTGLLTSGAALLQ